MIVSAREGTEEDAAALIARLETEVQHWRQGDVFELRAAVHVATGRAPLTPAAREAASGVGLDALFAVTTPAEAVVLVSQTCDAVRSPTDRPLVSVAPVVTLQGEDQLEAAAHVRPRYLPLPAIGPDLFGDLDGIFAIEKSALLDYPRESGVEDNEQARTAAWHIGRKFSRAAFPDELQRSVAKLVRRFKKKYGKGESAEGQVMQAVQDILVEVDPLRREGEEVEVTLIVIVDSDRLPDLDQPPEPSAWAAETPRNANAICERLQAPTATADDRGWLWAMLEDVWADDCSVVPPISSVSVEIVGTRELSYERSSKAPALDLDHLSIIDLVVPDPSPQTA